MSASITKSGLDIINTIRKKQQAKADNIRKISSGVKSVIDDAASVAIANALEAETASLGQARNNARNGYSVIEAQSSTLKGVSDLLQRRQELATQAANGTYSDEQRAALNEEYVALGAEIDRQFQTASFNGRQVFDQPEGTTIQVGTDSSAASQITLTSANTSSIDTTGDISSQSNALAQINATSTQLGEVATVIGSLGADASRLRAAEENISSSIVQNTKAQSALEDTDIFEEYAQYVANRIGEQTAAAALKQHNLDAGRVLQLLDT